MIFENGCILRVPFQNSHYVFVYTCTEVSRNKNPVRTSQETHYFPATVSSWLMLRKILGLHGCDYEECRLLGYKNPVRTSQETHYVSASEPSQLMLCKI
jgi:hypothetical protein